MLLNLTKPQPPSGIRVENRCLFPIEEGPTLKPSSPKVRHMLRPKVLYLGPMMSVLKPTSLECDWLPLHLLFQVSLRGAEPASWVWSRIHDIASLSYHMQLVVKAGSQLDNMLGGFQTCAKGWSRWFHSVAKKSNIKYCELHYGCRSCNLQKCYQVLIYLCGCTLPTGHVLGT